MTRNGKASPTTPLSRDRRGISQFIFICVVLAIIVGGIWSLYMDNAPYHPEVTRTDNGITLDQE